LKKEQYSVKNEPGLSNYHLFFAKYYKVLVCKDNPNYIIIDVEFNDETKNWEVIGKQAVPHKHYSGVCIEDPDAKYDSNVKIEISKKVKGRGTVCDKSF